MWAFREERDLFPSQTRRLSFAFWRLPRELASTLMLPHIVRAALEQHSVCCVCHTYTRREVWFALDNLSSQWVTAWPAAKHRLTAQEFPEVASSYLGTMSPIVRPFAGQTILCGHGPRTCDYAVNRSKSVFDICDMHSHCT